MAKIYKISSNTSNDDLNSAFFEHSADIVVNAKSVTVKHISFPNLFPNIRAGDNNVLSYSVGATNTVLQVPHKFYTVTELCDYLTANVTGVTFAFDTDSGKIKITNNSGDIFVIREQSTIASSLGQVVLPYGISNGADYTVEYEPNLFSYTEVYLTSRVLSSGHNLLTDNGKRLAVIATIPITVPYGALQVYHPNIEDVDTIVYEEPNNITSVDINLTDSRGRTVYIPRNHGLDISLYITPTGSQIGTQTKY